MGSNKKSSVGACKSYCMNFDSFKIVDLIRIELDVVMVAKFEVS